MVGKSEMHLPRRCPISMSKFVLLLLSSCEKRFSSHLVSDCATFSSRNNFIIYFLTGHQRFASQNGYLDLI